MPSTWRVRRMSRGGVGFLVGFRPHRLERRRMYVSFAAAQLASRGASNATPNQQVCDLGIVLCPTHVALCIVHYVFIIQAPQNLHPFVWRIYFNTRLLVRMPGLFCVRGMFKIFVGKNCRICQLYWCFQQSICSKKP